MAAEIGSVISLTCVAMTNSGAAAGKAYLCGSRPSNPGVAGKLDSCTVSSLGATPLEPREGALMVCCGSSGSLRAAPSSRTGKRDSEAGDELCTTIEGVDCVSGFLICARSEFLRERERPSSPGGGDLRRGETGQWWAVSPELVLGAGLVDEERGVRAASIDDVAAGVSSGMLVDEWARCTLSAGRLLSVVELDRLEVRLGLASALLLRERKPGLTFGPAGAAAEAAAALRGGGGRAGEASREDSGDEGETDGLSER